MKISSTILIAFLLLFSNASSAKDCQPIKEYDRITKIVSTKFVDKTFRGLNWPERVSYYRKMIKCSMNENLVADVVNLLLAELKASHTKLYTPVDLEYWALNSIFSEKLTDYSIPFSGIWARKIGDRWIARDVLLGTPAYTAGVRPGDLLLSIDGKEFSPLGWKKNQPSVLRFTSDGKKVVQASVLPEWQSIQAAFIKATKLSEQIVEIDGKKIGYFHLWCGTHNEFLNSLNRSLRYFAVSKVDGIVLDLRNGFGGASLDYLQELKNNPALKDVKKVLLINNGVRSGKEWITAVFKNELMGTVVGTTTAGAFLGGAPFRLFNKKYFLFLAVAEFVPDRIGPIEGIGVVPDIIVQECIEFCQGRDPQFERAIQILTSP